uniref:Titin n=1 Tax=Zonotrichia albicollis TaxID=44394 RepID=A0A8D2NN85_ZONAL
MAREQHVKAGDTLRLSAVIKGVPFPKVTWKKEDHEVSPKADIEVTGVGSKLEIRNTVHEDGGMYSLTVENPAGSKTVSVKVVVLVPPSVDLDVKLIEGLVVKAGTTVRLPAIMRGVPVPTAKWVTDDTEIKPDGKYKIETDNYSTVLTIKDCVRKDTGEYLLTVSNAAGSKTVALHLTVLDVPGPPTGPINILEVTPEYMVISWRPPKDDGGSPIINYIVEKRQSKKETWGVVSSGTSHTKIKVPRLQKGCEYIFRVRAENKIGIGAPLDSEPTVAKYMFDPPSPPGKPMVYDITENAATVSWTLPKSDGGTPITGYILERREASGKWVRVNKTPILDMKYRVTGLFEGNTYEFRVFAENMVGLSKPSPSSDPIKASRPITPPGPPINPKLKDKTKESADLVWTKPLKDGGSPILGYIVECQKSGTTQWNRINKDELIRQCAFRVPGLIEGNEYKFRIKAVNIVGEGEPRELPETVLAKDILSPPEISQTIRITGKVKGRPDPEITWSKDGKVLVQEKHVEILHDLPNVELQVKEAKRSDHGKYIIAAKNSCGQAQAFAIVNVLDRPGPCQNLKISYVTKDSCMISWESPVDNGGSEITNYIVEYRQPNQRGWSIVSSDITKRLVKANLVENREYFFRVCAENKIGPGPCIETKTPILAINPIDKPGEPENLHIAEKGKTFVYLKWRRPDYDGGSPNLSYHVERKLKDSDEWERVHKGSIKETHYMVDKCVENKIYQFRVQTKNEAGESNWVKTAEVVVKEDLQKPVLDLKLSGVLTVKAGDTIRIEAGVRGKPQPEIVWAKDKDATDLTRSPRVSIENTSDMSKFVLTKSRRTDGGKYVITATNAAGSFVAYATVIVLDKPGPVRNLKVTDISSDRCTVTWDPPEDDGGCEIQNYILEKCESKRMVWSTFSSSVLTNYAKVTRLIEGNEYIFRVRAENKMGTGPPTETHPIIAKTKYDRPGRPDPPDVTRVSKEEMTVVWNPPEYDGGKSITGYILEKKEKRSLRWVPVTKTPIPERRKKVTNLFPGHEYQFRVSAENEVGLGEPSLPSRPVIAKDPIGKIPLYFSVLFQC